jgi:Spy/CpxP family protein refolding chaperone
VNATQRRTRLTGMALLIVAFAAGMLAGTATDRVLSAREPDTRAAADCPRDERGPHSIIDELDLAPAQRARVDSIMARRRQRTDALWKQDGQRIRAAVDSARAEIRTVLTPEQAAEYDRLREQHEQERARKRARLDSAAAASRQAQD